MDDDDLIFEQLQEDTLDYYEKNARVVIERTREQNLTELHQAFMALLPERAHILDAGCGSGRDSLFFMQCGFTVTAIDASESLGRITSQILHQTVLHLKFEELSFIDRFDGIWASASLLHVPRSHIHPVFGRLVTALKDQGILYASFVYGQEQLSRGGILFNDYTEQSLGAVIAEHPQLEVLRLWKAPDLPPARPGREWLHGIFRKHGAKPPRLGPLPPLDSLLETLGLLVSQARAYEHILPPDNYPARAAVAVLSELARKALNEAETLAETLAPEPATGHPFSPREFQVLKLAAHGLTNKEIAFRLTISERTVQFHMNSIFNKTGASTRTEAVAQAILKQWLTNDPA